MVGAMRLVVILAVGTVLIGGALAMRHDHAAAQIPKHHGFAKALDDVAREISGRSDVYVRCGTTAEPTILGTVTFYGASPGREALLAPQVCDTLRELWARQGLPSLTCTEHGNGQCSADVIRLDWATSALAHESHHLRGVRNEAAAECYGLQSTALVAERLGAPAAYAEQLGTYTFWNVRPPVDGGYSTPDCRDGAPLDLHPGRPEWP
jgi:hypothetical protein